MKRHAVLALLLLLPWPMPLAGAEETAWWDERLHFRLPITLAPEGIDPATGRAVDLDGAEDLLVVVPLDLTKALRDLGDWPFDGAGRPARWTLSPASVRVVDTKSGQVLDGAFLPVDLAGSGRAPFDPATHAVGTLAVVLPGAFREPRVLHAYFDIEENQPPTVPRSARVSSLLGPGPGVMTMARVPAASGGAAPALVAISPWGTAQVVVERLPPGALPEPLGAPHVVDGVGRIALPSTGSGYDVRVTSDRPILLALDVAAPGRAPAAFFHAALDGGHAGTRFILPPMEAAGAVDVIGTAPGTRVTVQGGASFTVGRLGTHPLDAAERPVRIEASAPVLVLARGAVQGDADAFLHQALALDGRAHGALLVGGRAQGHAAHADAPTRLTGFRLSRPHEVSVGQAGEAPREAWVSRALASPATEPWAVSSPSSPATVLLGSDGYAALLGDAGMAFSVPLASSRPPDAPAEHPLVGTLHTPFPDTRVRVERRLLNGTAEQSAEGVLSLPGALETLPDGSGDLAHEGTLWRVEASKPVFLSVHRPHAGGAAFLPMAPAQPKSDVGRLEWFGPLLAWTESSREVEARPGDQARVTLEVANRGRDAAGAPMPEDATLTLAPVPSSCEATWSAALAEPTLAAIPSPGARSALVLVDVPQGVANGACLELEVAASSARGGEPARARVVVRARSGFEPELTVLRPDGGAAKSASLSAPVGTRAVAVLRLSNLGAEDGFARLAYAPGPGYASRLLDARDEPVAGPDGLPLRSVRVPANASVLLKLEVAAPTGTEPPWDFFVQATDEQRPTVRDEVSISVSPTANLTLAATPATRRLYPPPGGNDSTTLRLANGGTDVEVKVRPAATLPPGWVVRAEPDVVLLRAGATLNVTLRVEAPAGARVGDAVPLALLVQPTLGGSGTAVSLSALVRNDYRALLEDAPLLTARPADEGTARACLRNAGSAAFNASPRVTAAPPGWTVEIEGLPARVPPSSCAPLVLWYAVANGTPAGEGTLRVALDLTDGASPPGNRTLEFPLTTLQAPVLAWEGVPAGLRLAPGENASFVARLANVGNAPLAERPRVEAGTLDVRLDADACALDVGASCAAVVTVAASSAFGRETVTLRAGDAMAEVRVEERRRDVAIVAAEASPAGVLRVTVENRGDAPSSPLLLAVVEGDQPVAQAELPALPPGARAEHALVTGRTAGARVLLASLDGFPDATPDDNSFDLHPPERPAATPFPAALVLAALVLAALRRRSP